MENVTLDSLKTPLTVPGRILLALMFVLAGVGKLTDIGGTAAFMGRAGLPALAVLVLAALGPGPASLGKPTRP